MNAKVCSKCKEVKTLDGFNKRKASKDGYRPNCKACVKEYEAKCYAANPEKRKEYIAKWCASNPEKKRELNFEWRAANPEKVKESNDKYRAANPEKSRTKSAEYRAANPDYQAEYRATNPEKFRAIEAKRRAIKLKAIPKWLTQDDYRAIEAIYAEAKRLEAETGIKHHVDHIHPLQGKLVCGFHCPSNLQILTAAENCSKGNKFTPYVESELLIK